MRILVLLSIFFSLTAIQAQTYKDSIIAFQDHLNEEYRDTIKSPLSHEELEKFQGHTFFPVDENFKVTANFQRALNPIPYQMKTTTDRVPVYDIYGIATFTINGKEMKLNIYQSHYLRTKEKYKNRLFLPFTDLTNGIDTYTGGRYIDLKIPAGDTILIDFNKAYNPYCAYNMDYSCPIPPKENDMPIAIRAGILMQPEPE